MRLTENELNDIIKEEIANLIKEGEIDEKLFDRLANVGKGIKNFFSRGVKSGTKIGRGVGKGIANKTARDLSKKQAAAAAAKAKEADTDTVFGSTQGEKEPGADDVDIMDPEQAGATVIDKEPTPTVSTSTVSSTPPPVSQTSATTNSDVKATFGSPNQSSGEDNYRTKGFQALSSDDKLMSIFNKSPEAKKLYTDIIAALSGDEEVLFKEQKEFDLSDRMNQLNLSQQERHELINAIDRLSKSADFNVVSKLGSSVMYPQTDTQTDISAKPEASSATQPTVSPTAAQTKEPNSNAPQQLDLLAFGQKQAADEAEKQKWEKEYKSSVNSGSFEKLKALANNQNAHPEIRKKAKDYYDRLMKESKTYKKWQKLAGIIKG